MAFADAQTLVSVELDVAFSLVVRRIAGSGARAVRELWRAPLGPAAYDIDSLAIDRVRKEAWVASRDGTVRAFALRHPASSSGGGVGERLRARWHLGSAATAVAVSSESAFIATGTSDGVLCLRRRRDGALLQCVVAHQAEISKLDFAAHAPRLVSSSWTGEVIVWQVPSLAIVARRQFSGSANAVAFAPDAQALAVALSPSPPRRMLAKVPSEGGRWAQGSAPPNNVAVWDLTLNKVHLLRGHTGAATAIAWTEDGKRLMTGSWDRTAALWDPRSKRRLAQEQGFSLLVRDIAVAPKGALLAIAAWAKQLDHPTLVLVELLYPFPAKN